MGQRFDTPPGEAFRAAGLRGTDLSVTDAGLCVEVRVDHEHGHAAMDLPDDDLRALGEWIARRFG